MSELSREQAVVVLLRGLDDWVPGPRTSTGSLVAALAGGGAAKVEWFECPRCEGRGRFGRGAGERQCERCGGAGRIRENAYTIDAPSRSSAVEGGHLERRRGLDREIRRLEIAAAHRRGEVDAGEREPWERAKEALERAGSFRELRAGLAALRARSELDYLAVRAVYGTDAELRVVGGGLQARADAAVGWLAGRMPQVIRVPANSEPKANGTGRWANEGARRKRDAEIRRLFFGERLNREQIARRLGVDRSTVGRVLASEEAA